MAVYRYDGTFEGFLTCVHAHYYQSPATEILSREPEQIRLLDPVTLLITEEDKARKVYEAIEKKMSPFDLKRIYRGFASSEEGKEMDLLRYILLGFRMGRKVSSLHGDPVVRRTELLEGKVSMEIHRFLGLVRFSSLEQGVLYSAIQPDHDILEFLGNHFCQRLPEELFVIHDRNRDKAVIGNRGSWILQAIDQDQLRMLGEAGCQEREIRDLWRLYFQTIAIRERTNPRCQKNFMPSRYWKNLTEFDRV